MSAHFLGKVRVPESKRSKRLIMRFIHVNCHPPNPELLFRVIVLIWAFTCTLLASVYFHLPQLIRPVILYFAYKWANWALLLYECKFAQPPADACSSPLTHAAKDGRMGGRCGVTVSFSYLFAYSRRNVQAKSSEHGVDNFSSALGMGK